MLCEAYSSTQMWFSFYYYLPLSLCLLITAGLTVKKRAIEMTQFIFILSYHYYPFFAISLAKECSNIKLKHVNDGANVQSVGAGSMQNNAEESKENRSVS